jgi:capsular exopolysaccharide synthesis family protein
MAGEPEFYDDEIIDYRYYLDLVKIVLLKHFVKILTFSGLCVIASVLYVQSQAPTFYSTVTLHVAPSDRMFNFDPWMYNDDEKFQDTQIGILQSKKLLKRVVRSIDLHKEEKLSTDSFDAGIAMMIKNFMREETVDSKDIPEEELINATASELSGLISIAKPPNREFSSLLNVTVQMAKPDIAARTANAIAQAYIDLVFENEIETAKKNQQFLTDRLSILREDLRIAEGRLQEYREEQNIVVRSSGRDEVDEELSALSNRYFLARESRLRQENLYQQVRDINPASSAWEKLSAIASHPSVVEIQSDLFDLTQRREELSKRYGSRHNTMIALNSEIQSAEVALQRQVNDIIDGIRNEYELTLKIESAAEQTLNTARDRKQQLGRKEFTLNELTQDVETKRQVYTIFLERLNQDGASGPLRNDNLWIADPALVPGFGQRTPLSRAALIGFVLSFGLSMAIGLFIEMTSNRLTTGEDVDKKLHIPLLGYLPLITTEDDSPGLTFREYVENPHSRFSEALRTLRTSITLTSLDKEGPRRILITSSQSAEGKTSVALSLAAAFGQTSSVLIIDADLRKPSLEKVLTGNNHLLPGLSDIIAGTVSREEATQRRPDDHIDIIFAGSRTIKPLELLSSLQFSKLLSELDREYETIIIDSPPCLSVSDAYVLATAANCVVFVAKSEEAQVPVVRGCLSRFDQIDASVAGILLNQVDFDAAHNQHRYQDYYAYHGYGDNRSPDSPELSVVKS